MSMSTNTTRKPDMPDSVARTIHFGNTAGAQVDIAGMGEGLDTPFIQTATMVDQPFTIHRVHHIETKYGPRWMLIVKRYRDLGPDRDQLYAMTFSEQSPVAKQAEALQSELEAATAGGLPEARILAALIRQGKSYALTDWDDKASSPVYPL